MTIRALNKVKNGATKFFHKKPCVLQKNFSEHSTERVFDQSVVYKNTETMLKVCKRHTLEAIFHLSQSTHLRYRVPSNALNCFSRQSSGCNQAQLILLFVQPVKKTLVGSAKVREIFF